MTDGESRLRGAGLRVTPQRLAVLAVLERARTEGAHLLATEVAERSREIVARISQQTVYACLEALTDAGLVRRVAVLEGPVRFESATGPDHQHLICSRCGRIINLPTTIEPPAHELAERCGFEVGYAETVHVGVCRRCRTGAAP
ncbi:MAG TPA: Fur family transcriptional regulator [Nocardioides sp.]|nr:Fur family transcriptional regulator [Nocardioides sp.]